jgi:hypothetical protein
MRKIPVELVFGYGDADCWTRETVRWSGPAEVAGDFARSRRLSPHVERQGAAAFGA